MSTATDTLLTDHRLATELRTDTELPGHVRALISRVTATIETEDQQPATIAFTRVRTQPKPVDRR